MAVPCTSALPCVIEGYNSTHGDLGTAPVFTSATNSINLWTTNNADNTTARNIKFTHTAATRGNCLHAVTSNSNPFKVELSTFDGCNLAINLSTVMSQLTVSNSYFTNSVTDVISAGNFAHNVTVTDSIFYNNTGSAFIHVASAGASTLLWVNNIAAVNTYGLRSTNASATNLWWVRNSSFDSNTNSGIISASTTTPDRMMLQNNIFWNNTTNGVNFAMAADVVTNTNNAYGSNGTDRTNIGVGTNDVTLTGSPFTSSTNWGLNNTAGAGAACRAAGFPGSMKDGVTTGYLDIGAVQHQDSGGAAVTRAFPFVQ